MILFHYSTSVLKNSNSISNSQLPKHIVMIIITFIATSYPDLLFYPLNTELYSP